MADISMCLNNSCTIKETCYRYTAIPNSYSQSYCDFKQDLNGNCINYWTNSNKQNNGEETDRLFRNKKTEL